MPAMTAEQASEIEIPRWVPPELRARYREHAERHGEEEAAAWARRTKAGETDRSEAAIASAPDDGSSWWTEERVEAMRTMIAEGATRAAIAEALGTTRNAVVGKMDRLKIAALEKSKPDKLPESRPKPMAPRVVSPSLREKPIAAAPIPILTEPELAGVELATLRDTACHWPLGDPGGADPMRYCGVRVAEKTRAAGLYYCDGHMRLAYQGRMTSKSGRSA